MSGHGRLIVGGYWLRSQAIATMAIVGVRLYGWFGLGLGLVTMGDGFGWHVAREGARARVGVCLCKGEIDA